jgi:DNA-binding IclR family transcriptional regulator
MTPAQQPQESSIQVLDKASAIFDALSQNGAATAAELAGLIGEPRSSVYRLLASLQRHEMVEPGPRRGTFQLGIRLLRLGSAVIARFNERQAALPAMERLHEETGETIFLCIRRDFEAVCIERIEGERVQSLALRLGGSLPLHVGAAPTVLLAWQPEAFWQEYVKQVKPKDLFTGKRLTLAELTAHLQEIRERGLSVSDEDVTPGIAALGAPVLDYQGEIRASLSLSGTKPAILDGAAERMMRLTREAAMEASEALGYRATEAPAAAGARRAR